MDRKWDHAGIEPHVADMLADPIVHILMSHDHVGADQVLAMVEKARHGIDRPSASRGDARLPGVAARHQDPVA